MYPHPGHNCIYGVRTVGNQLIQAPDYNGSLGIDWRFARTSAGDLRLMVDGNYYAKQYFDAYNTEQEFRDRTGSNETGIKAALHVGADGKPVVPFSV